MALTVVHADEKLPSDTSRTCAVSNSIYIVENIQTTLYKTWDLMCEQRVLFIFLFYANK